MKYHINYNVLIVILLIIAIIYFLSFYKQAPVIKEFYKSQADYLQPNPFVDANKKDMQIFLNNSMKKGIKKIRGMYEYNFFPCSGGYINLSPNFWEISQIDNSKNVYSCNN